MKTLNEYLALPYRMELVKDPDEGGFVVSFPDLPGCITCGETLEAAVANAADAKRAWLQAALEDGPAGPGAGQSRELLRSVQAADSQKPASLSGGACAAGGHQHESILCISAFQKRCRCPLMRTAAFFGMLPPAKAPKPLDFRHVRAYNIILDHDVIKTPNGSFRRKNYAEKY